MFKKLIVGTLATGLMLSGAGGAMASTVKSDVGNIENIAVAKEKKEIKQETKSLSLALRSWSFMQGDTKKLKSYKDGYSYTAVAGWGEETPSIIMYIDGDGYWNLLAAKATDPDGSSMLFEYKNGELVDTYEIHVN